jgi:arsenate reductase (thioredoxin)
MSDPHRVLFLCTGNSARSIMAEAILNWNGRPRYVGYSAGSHPLGFVRPEALQQIKDAGIPFENFRSKSWDEFARLGAPLMDFVITVCDNAAGEACPFWPGQPITAHWEVSDPATVKGSAEEIQRAYRAAFVILARRISLLTSVPLSCPGHFAIKNQVGEIG